MSNLTIKNVSKKTYRLLLLTALFACLFLGNPVRAEEEEEEEDGGLKPLAALGKYSKAETMFDGVLEQELVGYLKMTNNDTLLLPVLSTGKTDEPLNMTVSLWFKANGYVGETADDYQTIVAFQDSVRCYITGPDSVMCNTATRAKMEVRHPLISSNVWINFMLSIRDDGFAEMFLHTNEQLLGIAKMVNFPLIQRVSRRWTACFGACVGNPGFNGGLREVMLLNRFVDHEEVGDIMGHQVLVYDNDFKAYYRFGKQLERFNKDYFVDRTWLSFSGLKEGADLASVQGLDFISNDVCEMSYAPKNYLDFGKGLRVDKYDTDKILKQSKYEYTMSMQVYVNDTTCTTRSVSTAENDDCSLMELEGVFMIYFLHSNMIQVRFLARKNYYETSTRVFFVPNDQWVTIQVVISHFKGYRVILLDQNGNVVYKFQEQRNMRLQIPNGHISIGNALDGSIGEFYLCQQAYNIPMDPSNWEDCLIKTEFSQENLIDSGNITNLGTTGRLTLNAEPQYILRQKKIGNPEAPFQMGVIGNKDIAFDGLACNDEGFFVEFSEEDAGFKFSTPANLTSNISQDESTVEFWIKPTKDSFYSIEKKNIIFTLKDSKDSLDVQREDKGLDDYSGDLDDQAAGNNKLREWMKIYIDLGILKCAPFGDVEENSIFAEMREFQWGTNVTDKWGWWHVTCSYKKGERVRLTVANSEQQWTSFSKGAAMGFLPPVSMDAFFGPNGGFELSANNYLLKEVRLWANYIDAELIVKNRFNQIDTTSMPAGLKLMSYYRLMAGSYESANLATYQPDYNFTDDKSSMTNLKLKRDFINETGFRENADKTFSTFNVPRYHVICPLKTYFMKFRCYGEPIETAILSILPFKDKNDKLQFEFTSRYSAIVELKLLEKFNHDWSSTNPVFNRMLKEGGSGPSVKFQTDDLVYDSTYPVTMTISNEQQSFTTSESILFVPNVCQWLELEHGEGATGEQTWTDPPGQKTQTFYIVEKRIREGHCEKFNKYSKFSRVTNRFILTDDNKKIENPPSIKQKVVSDSSKDEPLRIEVKIPANTQYLLPTERDIYMVMNAHWTDPQFEDVIDADQFTFQTLVNKVRFQSTKKELVSYLNVKENPLEGASTLSMESAGSFVSNVPFYEARRNLTFEWICPEIFAQFCTGKSPILKISWLDVYALPNMTYDQPHLFKLKINWMNGTEIVQTKIEQENIVWKNVTYPLFAINLQTTRVLQSSEHPTYLRLIDLNVKEEEMNKYDWIWTFSPPIAADQITLLQDGAQISVAGGAFAKNTYYTVSCKVQHKLLPQLFTYTNTTSFDVQEPPFGGVVSTYPGKGHIGDKITLYVYQWETANPPLKYLVFETQDDIGEVRGKLLTPTPLNQNQTFTYFLRDTPMLIVITDQIGESTTTIVTLDVLGDRPPDKKEFDKSEEGAISTSVEQKTGQRLLEAVFEQEVGQDMTQIIEDVLLSHNDLSAGNDFNSGLVL